MLEVGSGAGKATALFAAAGHEVVGLEPSPAMAEIGRRNLARFASVRIEVGTFEDWPVDPGSFDLVTAGQAWHWVDPEVGLSKAHHALRPGGGIGVFWNWETGAPPDVRGALDEVYERVAPAMVKEPLKRRVGDGIARQIEESPDFGALARHSHPWSRDYTTAQYLDLLGTHSDHRMLAGAERHRLHEAIAAVIDDRGGTVRIEYTTELLAAPRA